MTDLPDPSTFLSGESGGVVGRRLPIERAVRDLACSAAAVAALQGPRLDRAAARIDPCSVLVLSAYRPGSRLAGALAELRRSRHEITARLGSIGPADPALPTARTDLQGGKFENLDVLLEDGPDVGAFDWVLVVDDDIDLPRRFLERFLAACERLRLDLAQPAQTQRSHAAWRVARRRALSLARDTSFVEIGPLTAFRGAVADALTPFPALRFGWGLDNHWAAVAAEHGWRLGIVDATPVRHESGLVASAYGHDEAIAEARGFLAGRPYVATADAQRTLAVHRRLPA